MDTTEELIDSARHLAGRGGRRLLGVAGAPGSGKSTLAEAVVDALGDQARLVSMDGFHLAQAELVRLGRADRKGAPDTFDPWGYVALLRRLRDASDDTSSTRRGSTATSRSRSPGRSGSAARCRSSSLKATISWWTSPTRYEWKPATVGRTG